MTNPPAASDERAGDPTVGDLLARGRRRLQRSGGDQREREAALLLRCLLGIDEAELRGYPERTIGASTALRYDRLIVRRTAGEPVAYILGEREFYGRSFHVDSRVLIPRPESEHLVEIALGTSLPRRPWILDLGTGSGCLAVTLAAEIPTARVVGVDVSIAALACAAINLNQHGVEKRVFLATGDWTGSLRLERFDLVVSNPPYLSASEWQRCTVDIREYEPRSALVAPHGLAAYERLTAAFAGLKPGCRVVLEIGADQGARVRDLCRGQLQDVTIHRDLAGHDRVVVGRR